MLWTDAKNRHAMDGGKKTDTLWEGTRSARQGFAFFDAFPAGASFGPPHKHVCFFSLLISLSVFCPPLISCLFFDEPKCLWGAHHFRSPFRTGTFCSPTVPNGRDKKQTAYERTYFRPDEKIQCFAPWAIFFHSGNNFWPNAIPAAIGSQPHPSHKWPPRPGCSHHWQAPWPHACAMPVAPLAGLDPSHKRVWFLSAFLSHGIHRLSRGAGPAQ